MSFLLDTHILLWFLLDPSKLSSDARTVLSQPESALFVSAAAAWEISIKNHCGKLPSGATVLAGYDRHLARAAITEIPITGRIGLVAGQLDWTHSDPFDRVIVAQALTDGHTIITKDAAIQSAPGLRTLW